MTYDAVETFWIEPTDSIDHRLRRFTFGNGGRPFNACDGGYHNACAYVGIRPAVFKDHEELDRRFLALIDPPTPHDDPRWPRECAKGCGYQFTDDDQWQDFQDLIYTRPSEPGSRYILRSISPGPIPEIPVGAMWNAWWMPFSRGIDGICLVVKLPNGNDWMVDSRASNCDRPTDNVHHCWVRSGDPRTGRVTAGKTGGDTCGAGAGSILSGDYHGFLTDGVLTAG